MTALDRIKSKRHSDRAEEYRAKAEYWELGKRKVITDLAEDYRILAAIYDRLANLDGGSP